MILGNPYRDACLEWLNGCSCAPEGKPWECAECTAAFHERLQTLSRVAVNCTVVFDPVCKRCSLESHWLSQTNIDDPQTIHTVTEVEIR